MILLLLFFGRLSRMGHSLCRLLLYSSSGHRQAYLDAIWSTGTHLPMASRPLSSTATDCSQPYKTIVLTSLAIRAAFDDVGEMLGTTDSQMRTNSA
jgi:hypothetical protein